MPLATIDFKKNITHQCILSYLYRADWGLSHILLKDYCIFCIQYLGRLWCANVLSEPLDTIEQYRSSFNRNTMVINDHFIREGHLWQLSSQPGQVVTPHSITWKVISKLKWTKILVYSCALQCKKVQSCIEKFHWSKKLRKTEIFSFNLNIRVTLESVNLFLHVFSCRKVILTMQHHLKLLTIIIWKFAMFWSWQLALCNLGQLAPAAFFDFQQATMFEIFTLLTSSRIW